MDTITEQTVITQDELKAYESLKREVEAKKKTLETRGKDLLSRLESGAVVEPGSYGAKIKVTTRSNVAYKKLLLDVVGEPRMKALVEEHKTVSEYKKVEVFKVNGD